MLLPTSACDFQLSCRHVNMASRIDAPVKCEFRSVIHFLQAEGNSAAESHRRMSLVKGENFVSDGAVRGCCRRFKDGRTSVHDEEGQGLSQQKKDLV
ncbi:hypothetical protein AVEN_8936-1 [Araneus ventricosus]|uniref:Mos1 transposase HTH domain-containing protein n=1 Tax=Araneus ventricosus TaxID=182803 RepID=A0A4Y2PJX9_ARAVE|nr:hypothetical protein AVEN_8936-1 [Araneus ventricosus]